MCGAFRFLDTAPPLQFSIMIDVMPSDRNYWVAVRHARGWPLARQGPFYHQEADRFRDILLRSHPVPAAASTVFSAPSRNQAELDAPNFMPRD